MVSDISSKYSAVPMSASSVTAAAAAGPAPVKAAERPQVELAPIPKAEIKIDLERESLDLKEAIAKLNDMLTSSARNVSFSMDQKLGRPVVYVKNASTGEVVRQIPNEVVVRIAHSIEDLKGVLHNEKI